MTSDVDFCEDRPAEGEHHFSVAASKVMIALILGLVVSLCATAFSYVYFAGSNRELRDTHNQVPEEFQVEFNNGLTYICEDPDRLGEYACRIGE